MLLRIKSREDDVHGSPLIEQIMKLRVRLQNTKPCAIWVTHGWNAKGFEPLGTMFPTLLGFVHTRTHAADVIVPSFVECHGKTKSLNRVRDARMFKAQTRATTDRFKPPFHIGDLFTHWACTKGHL